MCILNGFMYNFAFASFNDVDGILLLFVPYQQKSRSELNLAYNLYRDEH